MHADIELFKNRLIYEKNSSPQTIKAYIHDLEEFIQFFEKPWQELSPILVSKWLEHIKAKSPRTVNRKLSSLRNFYHFLITIDKVTSNPFTSFKALKTTKYIPAVLNFSEMKNFLFALPETNILQKRNKIISIMLYATGIRSEELCTLKINGLDFSQNIMYISGKGNKERIVPLIPLIANLLKIWLDEERPLLDRGTSNTVFLSKNGQPLTTAMIRKIINQLANEISVSKKIHPHMFRYSFGSHLLERGADLRHIQELLGHERISVTQRYTKLSIAHIKDNYHKFHPRG